MTGALAGKLVPRRDAGFYETHLEKGGALVTVHCTRGQRVRVRRILAGAGAENLAHERTAESP